MTWAYRRAGPRYPGLFVALELQTAWLIAFGTLGAFSLYYDTPIDEYVELALAVLGLTLLTVAISLFRALRFMRPISRWIASPDRRENPVLATLAWETAVGVPTQVALREMIGRYCSLQSPG